MGQKLNFGWNWHIFDIAREQKKIFLWKKITFGNLLLYISNFVYWKNDWIHTFSRILI